MFVYLKRFIAFTGVFACLATAAGAAPIPGLIPVAGGPTITDFPASAGLSSSGVTFSGPAGLAVGGTFGVATPILTTGTIIASGPALIGGTFTSLLLPIPLPPEIFLTGGFLDAGDDTGLLQFLFSVTGGTAAADFGSLVLVSLGSAASMDGTLAGLPTLTGVTDVLGVTLTIEAVELAQAVPAPAGLPLVLSGLIAAAVLRRRGNTF